MKSIMVYGTVQAVGFRPFVYRIAVENKVKGYVRNRGEYVEIVIDGTQNDVKNFIDDLKIRKSRLWLKSIGLILMINLLMKILRQMSFTSRRVKAETPARHR